MTWTAWALSWNAHSANDSGSDHARENQALSEAPKRDPYDSPPGWRRRTTETPAARFHSAGPRRRRSTSRAVLKPPPAGSASDHIYKDVSRPLAERESRSSDRE